MVKIVAVGHRGTAIDVPENSLISHDAAHAMGARGIEFDIQPTKDNIFVVYHDSSLDLKTDGQGKVKDKTLAEIKALRLTMNGQVTGHQIPTLREALQNVQGRFMVDIDYKGGFENAANVLRDLLKEQGFEADGAPLVTIFCRDKHSFNDLVHLNNTYSVRPLYKNKSQARRMAEIGINVMGLRHYQFTLKRANRLRDLNMQLFSNTMKYTPIGLLREVLGLRAKRKKPKQQKLLGYYRQAMEGGALLIQTDYLPDLVIFLKEQDAYQDQVLDRNYQVITPTQDEDIEFV